jgi:hypothetical protein
MSPLRSRVFHRYLIGLLCTFVGAWLTSVTGSMLPLALGASANLLATAPLVKAIWSRKAVRDESR